MIPPSPLAKPLAPPTIASSASLNNFMPLTQTELDELATQGCQMPGCVCGNQNGIFFFHARCHPNTPAWIKYDSNTGHLIIECAACRKIIAEVIPSESRAFPRL
jgi:hypothetical protein